MNRQPLFYALLILFIAGCAPLTPQNVIEDYKAKREVILNGSVEENFQVAMELLPIYWKAINSPVPRLADPLLEAEVITGNGYMALLLGNQSKGGTGYYIFSNFENKTKLVAYSNEWYDIDTKQFHRFVDAIVERSKEGYK